MENTDMENTDMENADMENADMENADMENVDMKNADTTNSHNNNTVVQYFGLSDAILEYLRITALLECVIGIYKHEFTNKKQEI